MIAAQLDPPIGAAWALNLPMVEAWLRRAKAGDTLVYGRGARALPSEGVKALQRAFDDGLVTFKQQKHGDGDYSFMAERRADARKPKPSARLAKPEPSPDADEIAMLMAVLRRKAAGNKPCPTNRELGDEIGDIGPDRVAYLLRKQISAGRITVEAAANGRRVVTIVATGKRTAAA